MGKDKKPLGDMTDEEIDQMADELDPVEYLDKIANGEDE